MENRNFEFKKAVVFNFDEFEELIEEVTYGITGIAYDVADGWFWTEREFDTEEEWEEWLETYGEEAGKEIENSYCDDDEFVYRMIGRKYDVVVERIIVDTDNGMVSVIFEDIKCYFY